MTLSVFSESPLFDLASVQDTPLKSILEKLPPPAQQWLESLPWEKRRYLLSLCHLMCAATPEMQAVFLDEYTADGLVSRRLEDRDLLQRVKDFLSHFSIELDINENLLRSYIRQFYIHSAQDVRRTPDLYLESALRLVKSPEEEQNVLSYMVGFEVLKMIFQMSWEQHERLYQLQVNQDEFFTKYIKPVQYAHKINGLVIPNHQEVFFDRRDYFIKRPVISERKLVELVMVTFTTDIVTNMGFAIIRHPNFLSFDYEYIYGAEQTGVFPSH